MAPAGQYGGRIVAPATSNAGLVAAIGDLTNALQRMTGRPFLVGNAVAHEGIVLAHADSPLAPPDAAAKLQGLGREPFLLRSTDSHRLWIVANRDEGLALGIYTYLDRLGCRWLFPNERWTFIPKREDLAFTVDEVVKPAFRVRSFAGSGGFGPPCPVDPKIEMKDRWESWKRRNRFGGEYFFAGHAGEGFNTTHRKELEAHPEWLAMVNGKRVPWGLIVKPCIANPEVVKLYTEDRLATLRRAVAADPDGPRSHLVSVDPSDGGGHCECPECLKLGSVSDRVFTLANHVARAVAAEFPGRGVSLYAYNEHAAVPSIPIEPNVYVIVIPYAFHRTGMSGEELLAAWGKKVSRMSLYAYWSIPDWTNELPDFDFVRTPANRIRSWHANGVEGLSNETTHGAGAIGLGWYVASRLLWDPKADERAILDEFYHLAFGPAMTPMKRMLERWSSGFLLNSHELGLSFRDLVEARRLAAGDEGVLGRLDDYAIYLHYLHLWSDYDTAKPGSPERKRQTRDLVTFLWRAYPTAMVHAYRMFQLLTLRYEKEESFKSDFDPKNPKAAGWTTITPISRADVEAWLADGAKRHVPLDLETRAWSEKLVPLHPGRPDFSRFSPALSTGGDQEFEFEAVPGVKEIPFRIGVGGRAGAPPSVVCVKGPDGAEVFKKNFPAPSASADFMVPTSAPGRYRMEIRDPKNIVRFQAPAGLPFAMRLPQSTDLSPSLWFFVPKGFKRFAFDTPGVVPVRVFDPDGRDVGPVDGRLVVVEVLPGQDGQAWSLRGYKGWKTIKMLNLPQSFSLFPETLMVPENAR
ncbi:MAG: DUF4838 domain-containing protein [Verrucomicrobiae bacterium]|nr:DUF4838 domain-containing protein [Verrucomicrobiae bacterium]